MSLLYSLFNTANQATKEILGMCPLNQISLHQGGSGLFGLFSFRTELTCTFPQSANKFCLELKIGLDGGSAGCVLWLCHLIILANPMFLSVELATTSFINPWKGRFFTPLDIIMRWEVDSQMSCEKKMEVPAPPLWLMNDLAKLLKLTSFL